MAPIMATRPITTLPCLDVLTPEDRRNGADIVFCSIGACIAAPQLLEVRPLHGANGSRLQSALYIHDDYTYAAVDPNLGAVDNGSSYHISMVCNSDVCASVLGVPVHTLMNDVYSKFTVTSLSPPNERICLSYESGQTSDSSGDVLWSSKQLRISINVYTRRIGVFSTSLSTFATPRSPFEIFDRLFSEISNHRHWAPNLVAMGALPQQLLANPGLFNSRVNRFSLKRKPSPELAALTQASAKKAKLVKDEPMVSTPDAARS